MAMCTSVVEVSLYPIVLPFVVFIPILQAVPVLSSIAPFFSSPGSHLSFHSSFVTFFLEHFHSLNLSL